jgi:hypothetical protein
MKIACDLPSFISVILAFAATCGLVISIFNLPSYYGVQIYHSSSY